MKESDKYIKKYSISQQNYQILLEIIRQNPRISRKELSLITGVSQSLITKICADLLEEGFIREIGTGHSSGGRRPIYIEMDHNAFYLASLLISQDYVSVTICDYRSDVKAYYKNYMKTETFWSCDIRSEINTIMRTLDYCCQGIGITAEDDIFYSEQYTRRIAQISDTDIPFLSLRSSQAALIYMNKVVYNDQYQNSAYIHIGCNIYGAVMHDGTVLTNTVPQIGSKWNLLPFIRETQNRIRKGDFAGDTAVDLIFSLCRFIYLTYGVEIIFLDIAEMASDLQLEKALEKRLSTVRAYHIGLLPFDTVVQKGIVVQLATQINHGL